MGHLKSQFFILITFGCLYEYLDAQCTLPLSAGTWHSSTRGDWLVSSSQDTVNNFKASLSAGSTTSSLNCISQNGTQYVLGTTFEIFFGVNIDVFTCLDIQPTSSNHSFIYYIVTPTDSATGEQFTSDQASVCITTSEDYETPHGVHVLVQENEYANAAINYPDVILGIYAVTWSDESQTIGSGIEMDSCNDTTLMRYTWNNTALNVGFSSSGFLTAIYAVQSEKKYYIHTFNNDTTFTASKTYRIACWVFSYTSGGVAGTALPESCDQEQTSTSVPSLLGQTYVYSPYIVCPLATTIVDPGPGLEAWAIFLIVLAILLLIAILAAIIAYLLIRRQKMKRDAELKDDMTRQSTPDSIPDDKMKDEDGYDSGFDTLKKRGKLAEREDTMELTEVPRLGKKRGKLQPEITQQRETYDDMEPSQILSARKKDKKGHVEEERPKTGSSVEYETDEEEKKAREQALEKKRKRLAKAGYEPPTNADATVVGKKLRQSRDGIPDDLTAVLVSREQQEAMNRKKKESKKAMKKLAKHKHKHRNSPSDSDSSGSDDTAKARRRKKRKGVAIYGTEAPYTQQYYEKKDTEEVLDSIDFWGQQEPTGPGSPTADLVVTPTEVLVDEAPSAEKDTSKVTKAKLEVITQEEADVFDQSKGVPFPGKLGRISEQDGELPKGYRRDAHGNIIRESDGEVIATLERQQELRNRLGWVFSLPRLIRNLEGRPLGGYKDDDFGPTAEWDFDEFADLDDADDDGKKKRNVDDGTGKQVAFSMTDEKGGLSNEAKEINYFQRKGRNLSEEDREALRQRLFDYKKRVHDKAHSVAESRCTHVPVYFVGKKGGVKPESFYVDNTQIERQEMPTIERSQSQKSASMSNMVMRSDTFDDGRVKREAPFKRFLQNITPKKWIKPGAKAEEGIPAEGPIIQHDSGSPNQRRRNLGSDDEFILVGGSFRRLNKAPENLDEYLPVHHCRKYERRSHVTGSDLRLVHGGSMFTPADTRPMSGDDRRMRKYLQELYKDKKYFDYYIETEAMPTNAAVETRYLANHGREFLVDRAQYWKENQPPSELPFPAELSLPMSRMQTIGTVADTGLESITTERPFSADDAMDGMPAAAPRSHRGLTKLENSKEVPKESSLPTVRSDRVPPSGRSDGQTSMKEKYPSEGTDINKKPNALSVVEIDSAKYTSLPGSTLP